MLRREGRESDVLPDGVRDCRPVIGESDCGVRGSSWREVVAPGPAAEAQGAVATVVAGLPGDGARRVELLDPVGHLVVTVWVVRVVHRHPEHLPGGGQRLAVEGFADPAGAIDRGVLCWIGKDCEDGLRGGVDDRGRAETVVGHVATSSLAELVTVPTFAEPGTNRPGRPGLLRRSPWRAGGRRRTRRTAGRRRGSRTTSARAARPPRRPSGRCPLCSGG